MWRRWYHIGVCWAAIGLPWFAGCRPHSEQEVIVYAALDREFSEPILEKFTRETGIDVRGVYDVESSKTVGLVNRILQERRRPRCDLFWNNEILHTLRLKREGVLDVYFSPAGEDLPSPYRSPEGTWHGFAARARVLLVNREVWGDQPMPESIQALTDPRWKGKVGVARPLFGTTATHAAVLFARWGDEQATEFFQQLRDNAVMLTGNKQVALAVGRGELAFGLTDTDDAIIEIEEGRPVEIVFPDQEPGGLGTLFYSQYTGDRQKRTELGSVQKLVDYLLRPEVEQLLEVGPSAQFSVRPREGGSNRITGDAIMRWMEVDFEAAAEKWPQVAEWLHEWFELKQ